MRLLTATLRNYRLHRELIVGFDPARTLIGGPNESGKSTLVEAVHRVLFLRAKGNTELHRAMASSLHTGHPEVEVTFQVESGTYLLKKRFGLSGTITLAPPSSPALSGEVAETELARLLGVDAAGTARVVTTQWAHLWVCQGQAGDDPSKHATAQREGLLQSLQSLGGAAALQSERDSKAARFFADWCNTIFTQIGKPKAGSPLDQAERNVAIAQEELTRAAGRLQQLESAANDFENATRESQAANLSLAELGKLLDATETRAKQLGALRHQESGQIQTLKDTSERLDARIAADQRIIALRVELESLAAALVPQNAATAEAETARDVAKLAATRTEQAQHAVAETARAARLRHELAVAQTARLEKAARHAELSEKTVKANQRRLELGQLEERLVRLPVITTARLRKLQERESESTHARAALQAMATGLEIIAAGGEVTAGDQIIQAGQQHIFIEDTDLHLGSTFHLRIQPGGGTSLAAARQAEAVARQSLQKELDSLGLSSMSAVLETHTQREELGARIKEARAELTGLGAEKLGEELAQAHQDLTAATASVKRLAVLAPDLPSPENPAAAQRLTKSTAEQRRDSEAAELEARSIRDRTVKAMESAEETLRRRRSDTEQAANRLTGLKAQIDLLRQTHGDEAVRAQALAEVRAARVVAEQLLAATVTAIAALQPNLLEADLVRIRRALEQKQQERIEARTRIAVAQAALRLDGSEDSRAALATATARALSAVENFQSVRRKAEAVTLLDELFREEQRSLAARFTQPLADRISGYLECIFGPETRAQVTYEDNGFTGLRLSRAGSRGATYDFETLSGGAREQTAAALRLAMAEILAVEHDGCLPVVFDDAFAYSDPERVNQLQRMLDLAATRGLQVIVLTCNPADYAALGARTITLAK